MKRSINKSIMVALTLMAVIFNAMGVAVHNAKAATQVFQILTLTADNAFVAPEHQFVTGDDRGGIALSPTNVFYSGDGGTGSFAIGDLSGGTAVGALYDGLTSNLATGDVYTLGTASGPITNMGSETVTRLLEINGSTGALTGNEIALSNPFVAFSQSGIFAGYDRVLVHDGNNTVYEIALPSGQVTNLGSLAVPTHNYCENWAYWGVAEYFGGEDYITYVASSTQISRTRVSDGTTSAVATFSSLNDMCSFTVSPGNNRWYFHHEYTSQFASNNENIGYADATFNVYTPALAVDFTDVPLSFPAGWSNHDGQFHAVWGADANNVYAVGYGHDSVHNTMPLIYYSDGNTWYDASPALPSGYTGGEIRNIWGSSAGDIYAVGRGWDTNGQAPLLYHNDGTGWSVQTLPLPGSWTYVQYNAVWGSSASDVYVGGYAYDDPDQIILLFHFDGTNWTNVSPDLPGFVYFAQIESIWGSSANDIYAAGFGQEDTQYANLPVVFHYDGNSWTDISPGLPLDMIGGVLYEVWGSDSNNVYVVGNGWDSISETALPMILYYDGTNWFTDNPSLPSGFTDGYLMSIWGSGASDIYAVGYGLDPAFNPSESSPILYHYDGSGWTDFNLALPTGTLGGSLHSVWGSDAGNIYTVGQGKWEWNPIDFPGQLLDQLLLYHGVIPDTTNPEVTSIVRASTNPSTAASVDFTVTFSEDVTGVDADGSDFTLNATGVIGATITSVTGSGSTYTVTVNTGSGDGTIRLDVPLSATITDLSSNPLSGLPYTSGEEYTILDNPEINVNIGGADEGTYTLDPGNSQVVSYPVLGGPVVISSNGPDIIASLLQLRRPGTSGGYTGITQLMGIQQELITDTYVLPRYNGTDSTLYNSIQVANLGAQETNVSITIGGTLMGTYPLAVGASLNQVYNGVAGGPVVIQSDDGTNIIASLYELKRAGTSGLWTGQNQMMGVPQSRLSSTYVFPRYNGALKDLDAYLVFANADSISTNVTVTIGGVEQGTYAMNANTSRVVTYPTVVGGPVVIQSDNGANIVASMLQLRRPSVSGGWTGITQFMGIQQNLISDTYVLPRYNGADSTLYNSIQVGNVDAGSTNVTITIGGVVMGTYPLAAGASLNQVYNSTVAGPVVVTSDNGADIVVSLYELKRAGTSGAWTGQTQMMGLPFAELSNTYVFPRYNGTLLDLDASLIFAVP